MPGKFSEMTTLLEMGEGMTPGFEKSYPLSQHTAIAQGGVGVVQDKVLRYVDRIDRQTACSREEQIKAQCVSVLDLCVCGNKEDLGLCRAAHDSQYRSVQFTATFWQLTGYALLRSFDLTNMLRDTQKAILVSAIYST